ncbi:transcription initiation factor IIB family protein [Halorussus limi]|uniref:Transcription initiation factor IIB family protein n=2 Tax=Halorussus TaxID=1070314 RepID=A0A8U0IIM6_9EURY|nr:MULTISPECIES: transcription initiation factor IIB family protein [Halorussus]UPV73919.1 transcription initiation factor IIB family protein [Halorussus limi]UPV99938.1 transcription initiation factor IIB family protein [Halorussus gelatinilyticus]
MGETLDAAEDTMVDGIRLCGDVLRSGYEYDSIDSVAGACFYLACTRQEEPISLPDIADHARKSQKNIQHLSARLMSELDIQPTPVEPDTYLDDGIDEFGFTEDQAAECFDLLERGKERNLHSGFAPTTVAGAILYAVAQKHGLEIRQRDVADFVNKTPVSIRKNYKTFLKLADDVPVDVLPPQTIDEAIATLQTAFSEHPAVYADDARDIATDADVGDSASRAGVTGGAYLSVAQANGVHLTASDISSALGVGTQTIAKYNERFDYES